MRLLFMIVALLGVASASSNCPWKWCKDGKREAESSAAELSQDPPGTFPEDVEPPRAVAKREATSSDCIWPKHPKLCFGGGKRETESSATELSQDPPGTFPEDVEPPKAVAKREVKSSKCPWKWCKDGKREAKRAAEKTRQKRHSEPERVMPGCTIVSTTDGSRCVFPGKRDVAASNGGSAAELSQDPPGTFPEDVEPPKAVAKREAKSSKCPWKWCKDGKREAKRAAEKDWHACNIHPTSALCKEMRAAARKDESFMRWCDAHPDECKWLTKRDALCGLMPYHPTCDWGQLCLRDLSAKSCEDTRNLIKNDPDEFRRYQHLLPKREAMQGWNEWEHRGAVPISDRS